MTIDSPNAPPQTSLIAGRYELVKLLASGGVGEVFVALDRSTGQSVALKRLLARVVSQRGVVAHFMREYHALSALRHPRIIEVYDYGVDNGMQYYTMELLDGQDLRDLSPLPYREACLYLRDVASSLALIHARRLLHRDVSPRNVRRTSQGHCKLLDFGALIAFGVPPNVTGTAPCIAPEALLGVSLDQRSDLYSLGALAYSVLTGRHGYAVTQLSELDNAWSKPLPRVRRIVPEIPEALDELIARLMSLDPKKRPYSAAEVIEQLSAIGQLPPDETTDVARAFFTSTQLCDRTRALDHLTHHIKQAASGRGGAVVIEGDLGTGRSRILSECVLLAQTGGLSAVHATARSQRGTGYALAQELVASVKQVMPREAKAAGVDQLVWMRRQDTALIDPGEQRARLQQALTDLFCHIARRRPMLLTIDDVDHADEFFAALIANLAHEAPNIPLLVVVSRVADANHHLEPFRASSRIRISALGRGETAELVRSIFGTGPNISVLSDWLFQVAGGNPKLTLELAEHLLKRGFVRYADGTWSVSSDQSLLVAMPDNVSRTWALRMESLSPIALTLAELFAVRRGGVPIELCLALAATAPEICFAALDELVQAGVLESAGDDYAFAHEALRMAVRQALPAERLSALHRRWADVLWAEASQDLDVRLEAGWHLTHTEDELKGADIVADVAPMFVDQMLGLAAAIPALERALEIYERRSRPLEARLRLRSCLVLAGYLFDYRLAFRYGEETIALLHEASGLRVAERVGRYLGLRIGIIVGMVSAELRRLWTPTERRGPPVYTALKYFVRSLMGMIGVRATSLDPEKVAALFALVRPLAGAPSKLTSGPSIYLACRALATQMLGREADLKRHLEEALTELRRGKRRDMTEVEYRALLVGLLTAEGINESYREASQALARADRLDELGTHLARGGALRIRLNYYARRGDSERAEHHRHLLDAHALQGGTVWQGEWFSVPLEAIAGAAWTDLILLRRSLERLEQLTQAVPGLSHIRDGIRISYHYRRAEYARAAELGELYIKAHPPRELVGWAATYGVIALAWLELGQIDRAFRMCEEWLAQVSQEDRTYFVMYGPLEVAHATALALKGEYARAKEIIRARLDSMRAHGEHASLVLHYQFMARMAQYVDDRAGYNDALKSMRDAALASGLPTVILLADRIAELRSHRRSSPLPAANSNNDAEAVMTQTAVSEFLQRSQSSAQRSRTALWFLAKYVRCEEAHLFRESDHGLQLVASVPEHAQTLELERALRDTQADSVVTASESSPAKCYRVMRLRTHGPSEDATGVVALLQGDETLQEVSDGLLADLAKALAEDVQKEAS